MKPSPQWLCWDYWLHVFLTRSHPQQSEMKSRHFHKAKWSQRMRPAAAFGKITLPDTFFFGQNSQWSCLCSRTSWKQKVRNFSPRAGPVVQLCLTAGLLGTHPVSGILHRHQIIKRCVYVCGGGIPGMLCLLDQHYPRASGSPAPPYQLLRDSQETQRLMSTSKSQLRRDAMERGKGTQRVPVTSTVSTDLSYKLQQQ